MRVSRAKSGHNGSLGRRLRLMVALPAVAMLITSLLPSHAHAGKGERVFWAGVCGDDALRAGGAVGAATWVNDLLAVGVVGDFRLGLPQSNGHRLGARLEVRTALDALTWTPWLALAAGYGHATRGANAVDPASGLALRFGAGVSWRPRRDYSLQLRLEWEQVIGDVGDGHFVLTVGGATHRGGAAALDY
mgnify:CR=1 FL=1